MAIDIEPRWGWEELIMDNFNRGDRRNTIDHL